MSRGDLENFFAVGLYLVSEFCINCGGGWLAFFFMFGELVAQVLRALSLLVAFF